LATKYEEMCEAARGAQSKEAEYRDRCWQYMGSLVSGFLRYCAIPQDRVTFLKWNGKTGADSRFAAPQDGGAYTMLGATVMDSDGFWRLGFHLNLGLGSIAFAFWIAEQNGSPITKIADKTWKLDFSNQQECNEFYEEVVDRVKEAFDGSRKPKVKSVGFVVDSGSA
jgi:hypothetical protein